MGVFERVTFLPIYFMLTPQRRCPTLRAERPQPSVWPTTDAYLGDEAATPSLQVSEFSSEVL